MITEKKNRNWLSIKVNPQVNIFVPLLNNAFYTPVALASSLRFLNKLDIQNKEHI